MRARYDELLRLGEQAIGADHFERAAEIFAEAESIAREMGEIDLADRAFCNRCSVLVELDRGADQIPKLKEILLRSNDTQNRFLAAYCCGLTRRCHSDFSPTSVAHHAGSNCRVKPKLRSHVFCVAF